MLIDAAGAPVRAVNREIRQIYPRPGWVEHDPAELFQSCLAAAREAMDAAAVHPRSIVALGITNQRETAVVWERASGAPVANAIVWQCRRTAEICDSLKARGLEDAVRRKTGMPIDAYFTGPKIRWLLDNIPDGQRRAERGELACGDGGFLANLELHRQARSRHRHHQRQPNDAVRYRTSRLGRRAARRALHPARDSAGGSVFQRGVWIRGGRHVRRQADSDFGRGGRSARFAVRTRSVRARGRQEHLRDGLLRAGEHRRRTCGVAVGLGFHGRLDGRGRNAVRARRERLFGGRGGAVASGRSGNHPERGGVGGAGGVGRRQWRRLSRAGVFRVSARRAGTCARAAR